MNPQEASAFCDVMAAPGKFQGRRIKLRAKAMLLAGGIILKPEGCHVMDVTVHYVQGYEKASDAAAIKTINGIERQVRDRARIGVDAGVERASLSVLLEGKLEKNPYYHLEIARGDRTLMAWDYNYEYAFVVSRVIAADVRQIDRD